jgi:hypothetical protein
MCFPVMGIWHKPRGMVAVKLGPTKGGSVGGIRIVSYG